MKTEIASNNFPPLRDTTAMNSIATSRIAIAPNVVLDARLSLFHETERWLAVADLHFGYELSQRAAGRLVPLWGMASIEDRLGDLLDEYRPRTLIIVGDLVHDKASALAAAALLERLRGRCEVVAVAGNHDRQIARTISFVERWETADYVFHHGHCNAGESTRVQIIGHHHPAATITDGAGLRLKFPAFVEQERCWILPAFSPWAGGSAWNADDQTRIWICTPQRILRYRATP